MDEFLENIAKYEPLVAEQMKIYAEQYPNLSPALLWVKARRFVASKMYSAVSTFTSTKLDGKR